MNEPESRQSIVDQEQLRLLSIGYLVSAIVTGLFSLLGLFYMLMGLFMGLAFSTATNTHANSAPPQFMGWMMMVFGGLFFLLGMGLAVAKYLTSRNLKQHKSPLFCQVVAGISCLSVPYGTLLGISTFIVLGRSSVSALFKRAEIPAP